MSTTALLSFLVLATAAAAMGQDSNDVISGTYRYESSSNFKNYLKQVGVSRLFRALADLAKPVVTIRGCADKNCLWEIKTKTLVATETVNFRLDQEFTHTTLDGRSITAKMSKVGNNKLVAKQIGGKTINTITRTSSGKLMKIRKTNVDPENECRSGKLMSIRKTKTNVDPEN